MRSSTIPFTCLDKYYGNCSLTWAYEFSGLLSRHFLQQSIDVLISEYIPLLSAKIVAIETTVPVSTGFRYNAPPSPVNVEFVQVLDVTEANRFVLLSLPDAETGAFDVKKLRRFRRLVPSVVPGGLRLNAPGSAVFRVRLLHLSTTPTPSSIVCLAISHKIADACSFSMIVERLSRSASRLAARDASIGPSLSVLDFDCERARCVLRESFSGTPLADGDSVRLGLEYTTNVRECSKPYTLVDWRIDVESVLETKRQACELLVGDEVSYVSTFDVVGAMIWKFQALTRPIGARPRVSTNKKDPAAATDDQVLPSDDEIFPFVFIVDFRDRHVAFPANFFGNAFTTVSFEKSRRFVLDHSVASLSILIRKEGSSRIRESGGSDLSSFVEDLERHPNRPRVISFDFVNGTNVNDWRRISPSDLQLCIVESDDETVELVTARQVFYRFEEVLLPNYFRVWWSPSDSEIHVVGAVATSVFERIGRDCRLTLDKLRQIEELMRN